MAQVMGRLTGDAQVKTLENGKQLLEFSVAENFYYKTKSGESKTQTSFYKCLLWNRVHIASYLKKGTVIIITGQVTAEAYVNKEHEHKAFLKLTVHRFEFTPSTGRQMPSEKKQAGTDAAADKE